MQWGSTLIVYSMWIFTFLELLLEEISSSMCFPDAVCHRWVWCLLFECAMSSIGIYIYKFDLQIVVTFGGGYGIFSGAVLLKKVHYWLWGCIASPNSCFLSQVRACKQKCNQKASSLCRQIMPSLPGRHYPSATVILNKAFYS